MESLNSASASLSQSDMTKLFIPYIKDFGKHYIKSKRVLARKAVVGESIQTITDDGVETQNKAEEGDYVIKNQTKAGEQYIISGKKFQKRYEFDFEMEGDYDTYTSIGTVWGIEITKEILKQFKLANEFYFVAAWGQNMVVKENDYIVTQEDFNEVYRIARKEFFETYSPNGW